MEALLVALIAYLIIGIYHGVIYWIAGGYPDDEIIIWILAWPYVWYKILEGLDD